MKEKLKKFWQFVKRVSKDFWTRICRFIVYPQYLTFLFEVIYLIACAIITFIYNGFNHVESYLILIGLFFWSTCLLVRRWDRYYDFGEIFKVDSQMNFIWGIVKAVFFLIVSLIPLSGLYFATFRYVFFDNILLYIWGVILLLEAIIMLLRQSPFLVLIVISISVLITNYVGFSKGVITWSVLSFILLTVGLNLFDKIILQKNLGKVSEGVIVEKKLSYVIGVLLLFIWLLLSEILSNIDTYKLMMLNQSLLIEKLYLNMLLKLVVLASVLLFAMNLLLVDNREIIIFSILSKVFRKQVSPIDGDYLMAEYNKKTKKWDIPIKKVRLIEDNGIVKVVRNNSSKEVSISDMKRNLSDVIEIKKEYYIRFDSPKRFTIGGQSSRSWLFDAWEKA